MTRGRVIKAVVFGLSLVGRLFQAIASPRPIPAWLISLKVHVTSLADRMKGFILVLSFGLF